MSIRPIDMITMAPKSQEASQQHQSEISRQQQNQANLENAFAGQIEHNIRQTVKAAKSDEEMKYDREGHGSGASSDKKKKKEKEKKEDKAHLGEPGFGNSFDLKI